MAVFFIHWKKMNLGFLNTKILNYGRLPFSAKQNLRPRIQMKLSAISKMSRGTNRRQTKCLTSLVCTKILSRLIKPCSTSFHARRLPLDQSPPDGFLESFSFIRAGLCSLLRLSFHYKYEKRQHPLMKINWIQTHNSSLLFFKIHDFFN